MSVPGAKVPTARILVVGVFGIGVLNCGFSPSVCSATVTSLFRRGVARWTPCHEAQRVANAAAIFLNYAAPRPLVPSLSSLGGLAAGIAHREQALLEVYRVLRPSGRVLVRTVAPEVPYRPRF